MQILKTECYHNVEKKYKNRWGDRVEKYPMLKNYFSYFQARLRRSLVPSSIVVCEIGDKATVQVGKGCHQGFFTICLHVDERQDSDLGMVLQPAGSNILARHPIAGWFKHNWAVWLKHQ